MTLPNGNRFFIQSSGVAMEPPAQARAVGGAGQLLERPIADLLQEVRLLTPAPLPPNRAQRSPESCRGGGGVGGG